jgi:DNA repair exonuclease SbcCD ATPase subunit
MLTIKTLTVKNFLSVGNQAQSINFEGKNLVLVIGENMDLGGDDAGARNGTGKTTIINAISYAFYGDALTQIRKDNLVNKTNNKDMLVAIEFEKNGVLYKIERGRKPGVLRFYRNDIEQAEQSNEAQGENRETQHEIAKLLGMSHSMFKNIIALNTYSQPFLSTKQSEQREIIEQLLGITILSQKSDMLKEQMKGTKEESLSEKLKIDSAVTSNQKIEESINNLKLRNIAWQTQQKQDIEKLTIAIEELEHVEIKNELDLHKQIQKQQDDLKTLRSLERERAYHEDSLAKTTKQVGLKEKDLEYAQDAKCPTCEQALHDDKHQHLLEKLNEGLKELQEDESTLAVKLTAINDGIEKIGDVGVLPNTFYDSIDEAYNHQNSLQDLKRQLDQTTKKENPYQEQIVELTETAIQKIDYVKLNELEDLYRHQDFLYKLLTAKDSFIRTRIIEQNLTYLNQRLAWYLGQVKLPHTVVFLPDLTVQIEELGRELDFDNLSRGERNRLILSISWAFRDVWEGLYQQVNLLFIDELIDAGMDASGVESAMAVLKDMSRTQNKNIFLISHKDELVSRVNSVLKVVKENGFTNYSTDVDIII